MKKILLITNDFLPHKGGSRVYYYNVYTRIDRRRVVVLTHKTEGFRAFDKTHNLNIYRKNFDFKIIKNEKIKEVFTYFKFLIFSFWLLLRKPIGEIHCGELLPTGFVGYVIKIIFRIPYLVYIHGEELTILSKSARNEFKIGLRVLKKADKIIAACSFAEQKLLELGIDGRQIVKILPAVDEKFLNSSLISINDMDALKKRLKIGQKKILLTTGRLASRKGHEKVMLALPEVIRMIPDLLYLIVGTGPYKEHLETVAEDLRITDNVKFIGEVSDIDLLKYYSLADVFIMLNLVLPDGDTEGFGMVFAEANAFGKPVIGGNSGGTADSIVDGKTGFRVDPNSTKYVSEKIVELMTNCSLANEMGKVGRKRIQEEFMWQDRADKVKDLLSKRIL